MYKKDDETVTLKIESKNKHLSTQQIYNLLLLLDSEYLPLVKRIVAVENKWHSLIKFKLKKGILIHGICVLQAFQEKIAGFRCEEQIFLFPFIYNRYEKEGTMSEEAIKLDLVDTLYHEMRHLYQATYLHERYMMAEKQYNIVSLDENYEENWIEQDANRFAKKMIEQHQEKIQEILEIKERA